MQFEQFSLDRASAAEVVGLTEAQIANWITKYGLFPEKRQGKGSHFFFLFGDVIGLATIKALMDSGVTAPDAVAAVRPYSPYGSLLHNRADEFFRYPGTFFLAQNHEGRWVGRDGPDVKVSLHVRMWPIFDEVFPNFCDQLRIYARAVPAERLEEVIEEYRVRIEQLRSERWS